MDNGCPFHLVSVEQRLVYYGPHTKFHPLPFLYIQFYWTTATLIWLHITSGWFFTTRWVVINYDFPKPEILSSFSLKMIVDPWEYLNISTHISSHPEIWFLCNYLEVSNNDTQIHTCMLWIRWPLLRIWFHYHYHSFYTFFLFSVKYLMTFLKLIIK